MSEGKPEIRIGKRQWPQAITFLLFLFLFMSSVNMMGAAFKLLGKPFSERLMNVAGNPFAGLMVGVMTTAIIQSSSATTSLVVSLVAAGTLTVERAVPVIMGANIGTTITCTLVALGYVGRRVRFRRAFAGATMHDFFNMLTVAVLLPVELATGYLAKAAGRLAALLETTTRFSSPKSPVKVATEMLGKWLHKLLAEVFSFGKVASSLVMLAVALTLLLISLYFLTRIMKRFLAGRMETVLDRYIFRTPVTAFLIGLLFTMAVQSSSVTTSLVVPLVAAGVLRLPQAFPYTMGANVGTTITAFLAALGLGNVAGLTIALVHTLFNIGGVVVFFPFRRVRNIPVWCAETLASLTLRSRWYAIGYVVLAFFLLPTLLILLWR
ncbi:MAG: Na/Pi symporter [Planctomycetota bacterium]